jgi:DNA-binding response OmpR family regulator
VEPSILIIDDSQSLAEGMKEILTNSGYQVKLTYSGQEGLKKVKEYLPRAFCLIISEGILVELRC